MSDHPLLLDIFSLGPPQLCTGLGFLFSFKVSFEKHPNRHVLQSWKILGIIVDFSNLALECQSVAGVVVSCKIPILATRVRFPGDATNFVSMVASVVHPECFLTF